MRILLRPTLRRAVIAATALLTLTAGGADAGTDVWLVYLGGGIEPIEEGWSVRGGQVVFTKLGGTLVSVPYSEVDLPTSSLISWQLGGRLSPPPRVSLPDSTPETTDTPALPCVAATVLGLRGSETLEVVVGEQREIVHIACLDAPETEHRFPELGWFGRASLSAVKTALHAGDAICVAEQVPQRRDREGHRVVYVALADGRDFAATLIASGLALLRPGTCSRASDYRHLESRAIAEQRGLWSPTGERAAFASVHHSGAVGAGMPPTRRAGGG